MPTEINTFSAAIDVCLTRSGRPDLVNDLLSHVRTSMRESQVRPGDRQIFFAKDLTETELTNISVEPHTWEPPTGFRVMRAVKYPDQIDPQNNQIFVDFVEPGKRQLEFKRYHYFAGSSFIFVGTNAAATNIIKIGIAYYSYFSILNYFSDVTKRPARYLINDDGTEGWTYHADYDIDDTTRTTARNLVTNWMLQNWFDMVVEGALAKAFKIKDDDRASSTFALYKQLQRDLLAGESWISNING